MQKSGTNKLIFMVILKTTLMVSMCMSRCPGELAESQLAGGNPLSRPEQLSEGGSDHSDDPTQLKPKGRGRKKA